MRRKIEMITCNRCGQLFSNLIPTNGLRPCECGSIQCNASMYSLFAIHVPGRIGDFTYRKFRIENDLKLGYLGATNQIEYEEYCDRLIDIEFNLGTKGNEYERDLLIALILIWDIDHDTLGFKQTATIATDQVYTPSNKSKNRKISVNVDLLLGSNKRLVSKQRNFPFKRSLKVYNYLEQ